MVVKRSKLSASENETYKRNVDPMTPVIIILLASH